MANGRSIRGGDARGQSNPVALVLIIGLVIIATTVVLVAGGLAITDTQDQLNAQSAEKAMTQLDSQASLVALGQSESQVVEFGTAEDGDYRLNDTAGRMTITHKTTSNGTEEILQTNLGKVYYEGGGTQVAYQGGGVWRSDGDGNAVMISPPEFHYRDATLTLPVVTVDGENALGNNAVITKNNTEKAYPVGDDVNPVESGLVTVSVQSEFYRAWGNYFKERTSGSVGYDHDNNIAKVNLTVETDEQTVDGLLVSGGTGTEFIMKSGGGVDSYDSSVGNYSETGGRDSGTIYTAGDLELKSDAQVTGSAVVEGDIKMKSGSEITGDLNYGGDETFTDPRSSHVRGTITTEADAPGTSSVSGLIDAKADNITDENDNGDHPDAINALENKQECEPCNLTEGQYHLEKFKYKNPGDVDTKVNLKPQGGTIEIYVEDDVNPNSGGDIEVVGDGQVKFYVEDEVILKKGTNVYNEGDDASQFWFYMNPDGDADFKKNVDFTGVIYGPGPDDSPGVEVTTKNSVDLFGAVVGDPSEMAAKGDYHYDEALADSSAVEGGKTTRPSLTYLHISENSVNVTSD